MNAEKRKRRQPSFERMRDVLLEMSRDSRYEDEALPSERSLAEAQGICRETVRKALKSLIAEGVLISRHGKGTFVKTSYLRKNKRQRPYEKLNIRMLALNGTETPFISDYSTQIQRNAMRAFFAKGCRPVISQMDTTNDTAAKELEDSGVDGVLWVSPSKNALKTIRALLQREISVVTVGGEREPNPPAVNFAVDDVAGGRLAAERLLELGHERVLFVSRCARRTFVKCRFQGFKAAMAAAGFAVDNDLALRVLDAGKVHQRVLDRCVGERDFTAVFIADGIFLLPAYTAILRAGLTVPKDLSLITYDQPPDGLFAGKIMDAVLQPLAELGKMGAEALMRLARGESGVESAVAKPVSKVGASCAVNRQRG